MERHIPCDGLKVLISFGAQSALVGRASKVLYRPAWKSASNAPTKCRQIERTQSSRLQAGGLSREDAEAIHGGDAQALRRAMEERGIPAMLPLS